MSESIRTARQGSVLEIVIDRPDKKNALDRAMYTALTETFAQASGDDAIRAVLLTGSSVVFSSGNDISDFQDGAAADGRPVQAMIGAVLHFEKPIIAAVEGLAIGIGTTVLLHCDYVVAGEDAKFRTPFVDLGLVPEFASSLVLPRMAGLQRASEILLFGELVDAARAREIGFVNRVVPSGTALETARKVASGIAAKPPEAVAITRRLLRGATRDETLERNDEEAVLFAERLASAEAQAAFAAFFRRRK